MRKGNYEKWPVEIGKESQDLIKNLLVYKPKDRLSWEAFKAHSVVANEDDGFEDFEEYENFEEWSEDENSAQIIVDNPLGINLESCT